MNEHQSMLADMTQSLFEEIGHAADPAADWDRVEELGLPGLLVPENDGGFGGSWQDGLIVFRTAGYHALDLPLVEAIIAAHIARCAGLSGRGTIAMAATGSLLDNCFTGSVSGAAAADGAAFVVAPSPNGNGSMIVDLAGQNSPSRTAISGERRSTLLLDGARTVQHESDIFMLGAFARSAQIAGALDAALAMATEYANQRKQFGRALSAFQAVQQNLATFACEAAAANCAAHAAAQALDHGDATYEVAAAKMRADMAAGVGTAIAHQVHGAIGFTEEYDLHWLTRRLWTWRSEFGNDSYWADRLGQRTCARGADNFWPDLTNLSDRLVS
ncbi:acyl-CoA dehydrogenase [Sphingobium xenophagum]|uniref:Acyl-CoA dehydrogenase n=1 Tax=Sphingobium xenophagum TaxID=121428 RepID=A0ABU1X4D2_SPHXE|nr:acyl-CoA dehydrogenase [Sphingobium xenophagum]MDR7156425.1 acyl-CoA dehydrogenase [Sphingobium xenophagum]